MYYKESENLVRACYCKACESYFDYDPFISTSGYTLEGTDTGFCQSCLDKEDPQIILDLAIEYIKDIYIVTPQKLS